MLPDRGRNAPLVFLPVAEFSDAYRIAGDYIMQGGKLNVRFKVRRGKQASDWIKVEGDAADLPALANRIVAAAQVAAKQLPK